MVLLTQTGEVATFQDVDQFQPNYTQFACAAFSVAICDAMNEVGKPPRQTVDQMVSEALNWYSSATGDKFNDFGMTIEAEWNLLSQVGLHWQQTPTSLDWIRGWLSCGYPVIVTGFEVSFFDIELGDTVPYPWQKTNPQPDWRHVIVLTGLHGNNFLVRDPANVQNGVYGPLRPGPRIYDAAKMQLTVATAVVPPWLPRPPAGFDPRHQPGPPTGVPTGWTYDSNNKVLEANGYQVIKGFCQWVLNNNWDPNNLPLENERYTKQLEVSNPGLGDGSQQAFRWKVLEYSLSRNQVFEMWSGQELLGLRKEVGDLQQQVQTLQQQITALTGH